MGIDGAPRAWFTRPPTKVTKNRGFVRGRPLGVVALVVHPVYAELGLLDATGVPQWLQLAGRLTLTALAAAARCGSPAPGSAHEAPDEEIRTESRSLCVKCDHVVPDAPFCANCRRGRARVLAPLAQEPGHDRPIRLAEEPAAGHDRRINHRNSCAPATFETPQPPKHGSRKVALVLGVRS